MTIEHELSRLGDELTSALASGSAPPAITQGLADVEVRRRRRQRRRVSTLLVSIALVILVSIAAVASFRGGGQHVAATAASAGDTSAEIRATISTLFEPGHSVDEKLAQLDDPSNLRSVIVQGADDPRASELTLVVTKIETQDVSATAHIDFFLSGAPAMSDATLGLLRLGDHWVVRRDTYCALIATTGPHCPETANGSGPVTSSDSGKDTVTSIVANG